jgi:PIN domain nuclease of toxin-antitoxin system
LLDVHAYLWQISASPELSRVARNLADDRDNQVFLSTVSLWEIAIKIGVGKLDPGPTFLELALHIPASLGFEPLSIIPIHLDTVSRLPLFHRDPFDRLLVAQAQIENLPIVSGDAVLDDYGIARIW